ncbi:MAG: ParA family protein [Actinomycetota bacterium]
MDRTDKNRFAIQQVLAELFPPDEEEGHQSAAPSPEAATPGPAVEAPKARSRPAARPKPAPSSPAPGPVSGRSLAMGRIVAVVNQKGGVGKTTSTINLGAALAEEGARVLLVDFDPQGALSAGLGLNPHAMDTTVYNLLLDRSVTLADVVSPSKIPGLDLIPSNIDLSAAEVLLVNEVAREQLLKSALAPAQGTYNYILIDCPPSLGLLTVNALTAADAVLIPLECEYFALRGMALLMETVAKVKERLNPALEVLGIVATMLDARTIHGREVLSRVSEAFGDKLFKTVIHKTIKFSEAPVVGEPILTYASSSNGAQEYRDLAREVILRDS